MKIPFHDSRILELDARDKLYSAYLHVSMLVILIFSALFFVFGYHVAALIQFIDFFPFIIAARLSVGSQKLFSRLISIIASIFIVLVQTSYIFTPRSGFHYMLIPLIVVVYLISDLSDISQRHFAIFLSSVITISFFISTNIQISGPVITILESRQNLFYNLSLLSAFTALGIMLYLYALQLSYKEKALSYLAEYDALTRIHNRGYFTSRGKSLFPTYKEKQLPLSAIIFDIDNFKVINDTYGHHVGDLVLQELSTTVKSLLRAETLFSRYGGEEFAILLENTTLEISYKLAERLRKEVEELCILHDHACIKFTVSLGVSTISKSHHDFEDIMKDADRALYISKFKGKNKTWVINDSDIIPDFSLSN
ncbi:GGDEF domain-containing protein [Fusibacter bizertensis]